VTEPAKKSSTASERPDIPPQTDLQKLTALVQHQLNNPLAALLAESQLLAMEPTLDAQHLVALERIIELIRRVIGTVRTLDEVVEERLVR
jgi:signal transduction histidine kinase